MCKKRKGCGRNIDPCMRILINNMADNYNILACCCGHKRYPMTIIVEWDGRIYDLVSDVEIKRKKRFYKRDKKGYYFIPEVSNEKK